jgi:hypothetical protein
MEIHFTKVDKTRFNCARFVAKSFKSGTDLTEASNAGLAHRNLYARAWWVSDVGPRSYLDPKKIDRSDWVRANEMDNPMDIAHTISLSLA